MLLNAPGTTVEELRDDLHRLEPPYLLRKYEATEDDFEQLAEEDLRCEYMDGVLIVHSPATLGHEERVSFLTTLLTVFSSRHGLGRVFGSNPVMQLGRQRFCPDISFLATAHEDRIRGGRVVGPMDLVVEFVSKSTREYDLGDKRKAYREGAVPEAWFIDSERKRCVVDVLLGKRYRSRTLARGRFASRVLSGFSIDVGWLWREPPPSPLECMSIDK